MIDGQPAVEPTEVDNSIEQTAQTKVVSEADEGLPEKFHGKSKADIAQSYAELENKLGTQGTQLTELQQQLGDFQRQQAQAQYEAQMRQQTKTVSQQPDTSAYESLYYENPVKATAKMIEESNLQNRQQMRYTIAFNSADSALSEARRSFPEAFTGMSDNDIAQLRQGVMQNVSSGGVVPEVLSSSNAWAGAATLHRGLKTGFKFGSPGEVSANPTESPASVKSRVPPVEDYIPDEKTKEMMRKMGLTKEQQAGAVKRAVTEFERHGR